MNKGEELTQDEKLERLSSQYADLFNYIIQQELDKIEAIERSVYHLLGYTITAKLIADELLEETKPVLPEKTGESCKAYKSIKIGSHKFFAEVTYSRDRDPIYPM